MRKMHSACAKMIDGSTIKIKKKVAFLFFLKFVICRLFVVGFFCHEEQFWPDFKTE